MTRPGFLSMSSAVPKMPSAAKATTSTATPQPATFDCSVVMPLFNKGPYIERALQSVLAQTVQPREIIVMDGGSTDDGPARARALADQHPHIRYLEKKDKGVSEGRNNAIAAAMGTWVAFLDADDAWLPWNLEEISGLATNNPDATFLGSRVIEAPAEFSLPAYVARSESGVPARGIVPHFYDRWWKGNIFYTSSLCVRRDALTQFAEPFPQGEHIGEDLELFFQLAERGRLAATSRISGVYAEGVPAGLSSTGAELALLPCFHRLKARMVLPTFPEHERAGARRCVATKMMVVARNRISNGDPLGAMALLADPVTFSRPSYWVRTAVRLPLGFLKAIVSGGPVRKALPVGVSPSRKDVS